jgi:Mrp family chromosome partitioning ATPase
VERVQAAIQKAKDLYLGPDGSWPSSSRDAQAARDRVWAALPSFEPEAAMLERARVVTTSEGDPAQAAFDQLRTRALRLLRRNGWLSIGVTSPTAGCGKTTTCLNLAFSFARHRDLRTLLVDLDLHNPSIARRLGLPRLPSGAELLGGRAPPADCFVRCGASLAIAGGAAPVRGSAELLLGRPAAAAVAALKAELRPDVILYDLPPLLVADDAVAFAPQLDGMLLVVGSEQSRCDEVQKCVDELAEQCPLIGLVLNKCRFDAADRRYFSGA